jgi:hypothetical protein
MKKILIGLACCFASLVNAETLTCEDNYSLFEEIIQKKSASNTISSESEIYDYIAKYDYSFLFNDKHPNKMYWVGKNYFADRVSWDEYEWISQKEYKKRIKKTAQYNSKNNEDSYHYELQPIKANVLNAVGEICIIPVQTYLVIEDDDGEKLWIEGMLVDHLFVRNLKNNEWRVLEYNSLYIKDDDFQEFFPDLPDDIKNELHDGIIETQEATSYSDED